MNERTSKSRIKNSRRNIVRGAFKQVLSIGSQFVLRTVIIYVLGSEYQGVNGLFTSLLTILNLSDLGFSAAVTYILYKPIAEEDQVSINGIISYLKKVYLIIGTIILVIGLAMMPFLNLLISGEKPSDINIHVLFLIYLINSALSYFLFAYKSALLTAYQREDLVSNSYTISLVFTRAIQIVLLLLFHNYYLYAIVLPVGSVVNNILVQIYSKKYFPNSRPDGSVGPKTKFELNQQVKAIFVNRLSDVARNSFDNIVLSSCLGLVAVASYDNYYYIYSAIIGFMGIIVHGVKASIGNSLVVESLEKNKNDLDLFTFLFMWVAGWCTVCLVVLYQPFMDIWMHKRKELILPLYDMILFCIYFYTMSMTYSKNAFLEARGLFKECQKWYVGEAAFNLLLNILLGSKFGITGILIATIITIVFFNFYGGSKVMFHYYFGKGITKYFGSHALYALVSLLVALITFYVSLLIKNESAIISFINKILVCLTLPNFLYILFYHKTAEYTKMKIMIRKILQ